MDHQSYIWRATFQTFLNRGPVVASEHLKHAALYGKSSHCCLTSILLQHRNFCGVHHENRQPWACQDILLASRAHIQDRPVTLLTSYRTFLWSRNSAKGDFGASRTWPEHTISSDLRIAAACRHPLTLVCSIYFQIFFAVALIIGPI